MSARARAAFTAGPLYSPSAGRRRAATPDWAVRAGRRERWSPGCAGGGTGSLTGLVFVALCAGIGIPLARLVRLPAGGLLGPMLFAAVFALSGSSLTVGANEPVVLVAFALIGLEVGLRFTPASLRQAGALLPAAVAMILALLAACAALGIVLASLAGVSRLDGYLATTPGGLSAVLALSVGSRTNTTFILSVQLIRTFVMLLAAPPLARWIARRWGAELDAGSKPALRG